MKELKLSATLDNVAQVLEFAESTMEEFECPMSAIATINIAVEEIYVNIASYAYENQNSDGQGMAIFRIEKIEDRRGARFTFVDWGKEYNPLAKDDPDITLSAEERGIGGLGIFMVKKMMDEVGYEYIDKANVFTMTKYFD